MPTSQQSSIEQVTVVQVLPQPSLMLGAHRPLWQCGTQPVVPELEVVPAPVVVPPLLEVVLEVVLEEVVELEAVDVLLEVELVAVWLVVLPEVALEETPVPRVVEELVDELLTAVPWVVEVVVPPEVLVDTVPLEDVELLVVLALLLELLAVGPPRTHSPFSQN